MSVSRRELIACAGAVAIFECLLAAQPAWNEGEHGLWRLQFADGTFLSAADVATNGVRGSYEVACNGTATRRTWCTDRAGVTVVETSESDGVLDLRAEVTPRGADAKMFEMPANVRFRPESVQNFVYPCRGNSGIDMAFNSKFFLPSPDDKPTQTTARARTSARIYVTKDE